MLTGRSKAKAAPSVFGAAIQGRRHEQQDAFRTRWLKAERAWLLVVADGMGGHAAGGLASRIAVDGFLASFAALREAGAELQDAFRKAVEDANTRIAKAQAARPELAGMGTTIVGAYLCSRGIAWISVGDSPLWLYRRGDLLQLNEDHSLRHTVEADSRGVGNMLQSVLNGQRISLIDCHAELMPLRTDDLILVGTDGLLTLSEKQIARQLDENGTKDPQHLTLALLQTVEHMQKPNQDNCTLIIASAPRKKGFPGLHFHTGLRRSRRAP
jgi:serine/threonine protein phosphatase PrpC